MRCLPFIVLAAGCVTTDLNVEGEFKEGELVAAIATCAPDQWCTEPLPGGVRPRLRGVWALHANDVFAVGDGGAIFRRIDDVWTAMASGTSTNLLGVWASSANDVWAAGRGTIVRFNGTAWSSLTVVDGLEIDAVWGSSPTDVWFVGSGRVLRWNGSGFTSTTLGGTLTSVSGTGPNDVWVTAENIQMRRWNGATWLPVNAGMGTNSLSVVHALTPNDVWAASFNNPRETSHFADGRWTTRTTNWGFFQGMSSLGSNDVWAAGFHKIGRWNGTAWSIEQPFGTGNVALEAVTTTPGHVWVVGNAGLVGHRAL